MCPVYGIARCPYFRGFQSMGVYGSVLLQESVRLREVSAIGRCPLTEVSLYTLIKHKRLIHIIMYDTVLTNEVE